MVMLEPSSPKRASLTQSHSFPGTTSKGPLEERRILGSFVDDFGTVGCPAVPQGPQDKEERLVAVVRMQTNARLKLFPKLAQVEVTQRYEQRRFRDDPHRPALVDVES